MNKLPFTVKRLFDLVVVLLLFPMWFPLFLIVALAVWIKLGQPILFRQSRPGQYAKPFYMLKFRTMLNTTDSQGNLLSDSKRLTPFGKFLRSTSLDELPELWNILRGHMSLVGPRPLLIEYLPLYNIQQARRHEVRPGLTGWAQVNGRNAISWEEKFNLDLWYIEHHSFKLDLKILWMTLLKVLKRENISATGEATMQRFTNNKQ